MVDFVIWERKMKRQCINKYKTIQTLKIYFSDDGDGRTEMDAYWHHNDVIKCIEDMEPEETCEYWDDESNYCTLNRPSIQPEQKKGHWDEDGCCSECGGDPMDFIDSYDAYIETPMLYCPRCGAKMEIVDALDYIHKPIKERLMERERR